jgi:hypothetical protein
MWNVSGFAAKMFRPCGETAFAFVLILWYSYTITSLWLRARKGGKMLNKILNLYNTRKTTLAFATGAVLGLLIGLLFAWVIWPTSFYNATPAMLRQDFRDDYLAWVAREYAQDQNLDRARARLGLEYWKKDPVALLEEVGQKRADPNIQNLAQALKAAPPPTPTGPTLIQRQRPYFRFAALGYWLPLLPPSCILPSPASGAPGWAVPSPSGPPPTGK